MKKLLSLVIFIFCIVSVYGEPMWDIEAERKNNADFDDLMTSLEFSERLDSERKATEERLKLIDTTDCIETDAGLFIEDEYNLIDEYDSFYGKCYSDYELEYCFKHLFSLKTYHSFEYCASSAGVFFCKLARTIEKRAGKTSSVIQRELLANSFIQSRFNQFNTDLIKRGGRPLDINKFKKIHDKICVYMEYYYKKGFYRKGTGIVVVGNHTTWIDLPMDETEALLYVQGFCGALIMIIPGCTPFGAEIVGTAAFGYLQYQIYKENKKGALRPPKTPTKDLDEKLTLETQDLDQYLVQTLSQ